MKQNLGKLTEVLAAAGIDITGLEGAFVRAVTGADLSVFDRVAAVQRPSYRKFHRKVADAVKVRGTRFLHEIVEGRLDKAREELAKLTTMLERLLRINEHAGSEDVMEGVKESWGRFRYWGRYLFRRA